MVAGSVATDAWLRPVEAVSRPLADAAVLSALADRWGIAAELKRLPTECDQVFLVAEVSGRRRVLRIVSGAKAEAELLLQNAALGAVRRHAPQLPVPVVIPSLAGRAVEQLDAAGVHHSATLYTYLVGEPVGRTVGSRAQREELGATLAHLDCALANLDWPSESDPFPWNVLRVGELRPLLVDERDAGRRRLAEAAIDDFMQGAQGALHAMPRQFIHNDFNAKNVLVDLARPEVVTGIIDFGDLLRAPRIVDLGVAIARQIGVDRPVEDGADIVGAYHRVSPLGEEEIGLLHHIVCARLAIRLTVWSWRARRGRAGDDPAVPAQAAVLLDTFRRFGEAAATARFRTATGHAGC